jgi:restriction endonuclease S subunit
MQQLSDIANIYSGLPVNGVIKDETGGEMLIVQPSNGTKRQEISWDNVALYSIPEQRRHRKLAKNDILIRAVGSVNPAWIVPQIPEKYPAVAHQHFFIIRLKDNNWDPLFVTLLLNSKASQEHFRNQASGKQKGVIRRGVLEDFVLPGVSLPDQGKLAANWQEYCDKIENLDLLEANLTQDFINELESKI